MEFPVKDVEMFAGVVLEKERIPLTINGKVIGALVPLEDYEYLEELTDMADSNEAALIMEKTKGEEWVNWEEAFDAL